NAEREVGALRPHPAEIREHVKVARKLPLMFSNGALRNFLYRLRLGAVERARPDQRVDFGNPQSSNLFRRAGVCEETQRSGKTHFVTRSNRDHASDELCEERRVTA